MPRYLDLLCDGCGVEFDDVFVRVVPDEIIHYDCGAKMSQVYKPRRPHQAQWRNGDCVVVFRKPDGSISYPPRNDAPTPANCERVTMTSLREVEKFCKDNNVSHEASHFDKGSGRGFDDGFNPKMELPREERYRRFLKAWKG